MILGLLSGKRQDSLWTEVGKWLHAKRVVREPRDVRRDSVAREDEVSDENDTQMSGDGEDGGYGGEKHERAGDNREGDDRPLLHGSIRADLVHPDWTCDCHIKDAGVLDSEEWMQAIQGRATGIQQYLKAAAKKEVRKRKDATANGEDRDMATITVRAASQAMRAIMGYRTHSWIYQTHIGQYYNFAACSAVSSTSQSLVGGVARKLSLFSHLLIHSCNRGLPSRH
jgi:hypothetical protein